MRRRDEYGYNNMYPEPDIPDNWPDIERRYLNAQRHLDDGLIGLEHGMSYEGVGWNLQRSIENALKGIPCSHGTTRRTTPVDGIAGPGPMT